MDRFPITLSRRTKPPTHIFVHNAQGFEVAQYKLVVYEPRTFDSQLSQFFGFLGPAVI